MSLDEKEVNKTIETTNGLKQYDKMIKMIMEEKPHVLSEIEEKIIASVSDCLNAPENIYGMLTNADITFPVIKDENGNDVELTDTNYSVFIRSKDRNVRKQAFESLFDTYAKFKNTIATTYTSSVKNFIFEANIRKYNSSLESSLKPNKIPLEVYSNVVDTINNRLGSLHKYVELKKKLLNLSEIHMYDLYRCV